MSYIKHYILDRDEELDYLIEEIRSRYDFIASLSGIDTDGFLYDVTATLIEKLLDAHYDLAIFHGGESDPYEAACQYLGNELMDRIVAEHHRRQERISDEGIASVYPFGHNR